MLFNGTVTTRGNRPAPVALSTGNGNTGLALAIDPENRSYKPDTFILFNIPQGTFVHSNAEVSVTLEASLEDGNELPGWLSFDASTGVFSGTPPDEFEGRLSIRVIAKDSDGLEAVATFELIISEDAPEQVDEAQPADEVQEGEEQQGEEQQDEEQQEQSTPSVNANAAPANNQVLLHLLDAPLVPEGHAGLHVQLARAAGHGVLGSALALLDQLA